VSSPMRNGISNSELYNGIELIFLENGIAGIKIIDPDLYVMFKLRFYD